MKIIPLGCSGSAINGLDTTSFLLNDNILIDAGTGTRKLSYDSLSKIKNIIITHSHIDHIVQLPFIADTLFGRINRPINILCHPETERCIRKYIFNGEIWPDFLSLKSRNNDTVFRIIKIYPGEEFHLDQTKFTAIKMNHIVPTLGVVAREDNASLAFSSDTKTNDMFWNVVNKNNVDLLIAECAFPSSMKGIAEQAGHYSPYTLSEDLKKLKIDTNIKISHLKAGHEDHIMREIHELTNNYKIERLLCRSFLI